MYLSANQRAELEADEIIFLNLGGLGSGKTATVPWLILDRAGDTEQFGGLFANTHRQLHQAILPLVTHWLDVAHVDYIFGRRPPHSWQAAWDASGIQTPGPLTDYKGILVLETGLHIVTGSLDGENYWQLRSLALRWAIVEEISSGPKQAALEMVIQRVRCDSGDAACAAAQHRHQTIVHGNPPLTPSHWLFQFIERLKEHDAKVGGGFFRFIQSSTRDNIDAVGTAYLDTLEATLDEQTALALIDGQMVKNRTGLVYRAYSDANLHPVEYVNDRRVHVTLDFNNQPAVAVLGHELLPGEYPAAYHREGLKHFGVFGELFFEEGLDAEELALRLLRGGSGLHVPDNFDGLLNHQNPIIVTGDPAGGQRRMESSGGPDGRPQSAWTIIQSVFRENLGRRYVPDIPKAAPSVFLSVQSVNAKFHSRAGHRSMWIDPRCKMLIRDLESVPWNKDGTEIEKDTKNPQKKMLTHISDALRYLIHLRYPVSLNTMKKQAGQLGSVAMFDKHGPLGRVPNPYGR